VCNGGRRRQQKRQNHAADGRQLVQWPGRFANVAVYYAPGNCGGAGRCARNGWLCRRLKMFIDDAVRPAPEDGGGAGRRARNDGGFCRRINHFIDGGVCPAPETGGGAPGGKDANAMISHFHSILFCLLVQSAPFVCQQISRFPAQPCAALPADAPRSKFAPGKDGILPQPRPATKPPPDGGFRGFRLCGARKTAARLGVRRCAGALPLPRPPPARKTGRARGAWAAALCVRRSSDEIACRFIYLAVFSQKSAVFGRATAF